MIFFTYAVNVNHRNNFILANSNHLKMTKTFASQRETVDKSNIPGQLTLKTWTAFRHLCVINNTRIYNVSSGPHITRFCSVLSRNVSVRFLLTFESGYFQENFYFVALGEKCPNTEFFFGPNKGKYGPKKLRIWTLFAHRCFQLLLLIIQIVLHFLSYFFLGSVKELCWFVHYL